MQNSQKYDNPPQPQAPQFVYYDANATNYSNLERTPPYYAPHQMPIDIGSYPGQMIPPYQHIANPNTPEVPEVKGLAFSTESIRKGFIRKVYSILLVIATYADNQQNGIVKIAIPFCHSRFNC